MKSQILTWSLLSVALAQYYCLDLFDDFNGTAINKTLWKHDQTLAGGGNWEFEWYTDNSQNSFVKDGKLTIRPTFTSDFIGESVMISGGVVDLGANCTWSDFYGCKRGSDGKYIINPIRSAALRTVNSYSLTFGKVEVRAKFPKGDWLWPKIWMLPRDSFYGPWPTSGDVNIAETRGNAPKGSLPGIDTVSSTLNWGTDYSTNRYNMTSKGLKLTDGKNLNDDFHVYGLQWTKNYIATYMDTPSNVIMNVSIVNLFQQGNFGKVANPWANTTSGPFDQPFYLMINLGVGGLGPYWQGYGGKELALDFWNDKANWGPTWGTNNQNADFVIDYVKTWKECANATPSASISIKPNWLLLALVALLI